MQATAKSYRYQLPQKAVKGDCPDCSPHYRKTLSRYIDTQTGELLPEQFGRCDRESNCGYYLGPYSKTQSGTCYAGEVFQKSGLPKPFASHQYRTPAPQPTASQKVYLLPDEVVNLSSGHYRQNQFYKLLSSQFGDTVATMLVKKFRIGTSAYWPGATVFWLVDDQGCTRAGQLVLFADDWHKARYINKEGDSKVCISSVSSGLLRRYRQLNLPTPEWLMDYHKNAPRWPVLFGLHQLKSTLPDQPIAVVEAPKTAVVCSAIIPNFTWLAAGSLSYLNADRLAPLHGRAIVLYPDLSTDGKAFARWSKVADELRAQGYNISVSSCLENVASDEQKQAGLDLADFLLNSPATVSTLIEQLAKPGSILRPQESQIERLTVDLTDSYPVKWDEPNPPGAKPKISAQSFHDWQCQDANFGKMGLASLPAPSQINNYENHKIQQQSCPME